MSESNLIKNNFIALNENTKSGGLYESYYFRGNSLNDNGKYSFWLKHNFLRFKNEDSVRIDNILIVFNNETKKQETYEQSKTLSCDEFFKLSNSVHNEWSNLAVYFTDDNFFYISENRLKGKINDSVSWDFELKLSNETYFHFDKKWFYFGFFPKKKILTKDIRVNFSGELKSPLITLNSNYLGMNGHNWGKEHAYNYAYADCNQLYESNKLSEGSYFDGFSVKILIGPILSPYLSCCSLKYNNKWYHFNRVLDSFKHQVSKLTEKNWDVLFLNEDYSLDVSINGNNQTWVSLMYDHPNRKKSKVNNTKRANAKLTLIDRRTKLTIAVLESDYFELETLVG